MRTRYFYGYNIVAAGFVIQAVCIGSMFTYGVFFKELEAAFGWSRTLLSGASSFAFFIMGAGGILAGALNDRIGPRIILTFSGASLGVGYMLMSQMTASWQLYLLYGLAVGIGFSTHDVVTLSTTARWFVKRRGMMSGAVKVGTGVGQLVSPLIAAALIHRLDWRVAYQLIGGFSLIGLTAAAGVMKRDPLSIGLQPDGGKLKHSDAEGTERPGLTLVQAMKTRSFRYLAVVEFIIFFCLLTTIVHIVPYARDQGLKPTTAAAVLSVIGGVSMLGRIVMGTANDHIGGKRSLLISFAFLLSALICLQSINGVRMFFLFAVLYGLAHGAFFTVMSPTAAELFGTESHGLIFGMILFCGTIGGSLGPLTAGTLFDLTGDYRLVFMILTVLTPIGSILAALIKPVAVTGEQ